MSLLIFLILALMVIPCISINADDEQTIYVAYFDQPGYISKNKIGIEEGYAVDYLRKLEEYSDLEFKFIKKNYGEVLNSLENGTADIACNITKVTDRTDDYYFSDQMIIMSEIVLLAREDDTSFYYDDFETFEGATVGITNTTYFINGFMKYAEEHSFNCNIKYYDNEQDAIDALMNNEVDICVNNNLSMVKNVKCIGTCGYVPMYIAGAKDSELINSINEAVNKVYGNEPNFVIEIYEKYFKTIKQELSLTREEQEYVKQGNVIKVGQYSNRYPLSSYDEVNGTFSGIYPLLMDYIAEKSGLKFEYVCIPNNQRAIDFMKGGDCDVLAGVTIHENYKYLKDVTISNYFLQSEIVMVGKSGYSYSPFDTLTVALPKDYVSLSEFLTNNYENVSIIWGEDSEDCMNMVRKGTADVVIQNTYVVSSLLQRPLFENLEIVPTYKLDDNSAVVFEAGDNELLISIINKTIASLDSEVVSKIVISRTIADLYSPSFGDFIYMYRYMLITILFLITVCVAMIVFYTISNMKHMRELETNNEFLERAISTADRANKAKSDFLSHMSHEIRTPMSAILGITDLMSKGDYNEQAMRGYVEKIQYSSKILLNIINDILDMSAIESKKLKLSHLPIDLNEILDAINVIYMQQCEQKGIRFIVEKNVTNQLVLGDTLRLNQILINLLSNAVKFTEKGGTIKLNSETKYVLDTVVLRMSVSDTGCGMTKDMQLRLFTPFEQESSNVALKYGGSGLGLSIVHSLVDLMKGGISVNSVKNKGTDFIIEIPLKIAEGESENKSKETEYPLTVENNYSGMRVLLVEDNEINRDIIAQILRGLKLDVECAINGLDAYEKFTGNISGYFDMIFMDLQMPVMDGYTATRRIRRSSKEEAKTIPIFAMSANVFEDDVARSKEAGMNAHISKPIDIQQLKEIISLYIKK